MIKLQRQIIKNTQICDTENKDVKNFQSLCDVNNARSPRSVFFNLGSARILKLALF